MSDLQAAYDALKAQCDEHAEMVWEQMMKPYAPEPDAETAAAISPLRLPLTQERAADIDRAYRRACDHIYAPLVRLALMMPPKIFVHRVEPDGWAPLPEE